MLIHVFNGDLTFHCVNMIRNILKYSKHNHYFILCLTEEDKRSVYQSIFEEFNFVQFIFCTNEFEHKNIWWLTSLGVFKRDRITNQEKNLINLISRFKKYPILFHGYLYSPFIVFLIAVRFLKSVSWVCWGQMLRSDFSKLSLKDKILYRFTEKAYTRFKSIVCLLERDRVELIQNFGCSNVKTLSYLSEYILHADENILNMNNDNEKLKVLIGNSAHNIPNYIDILKKIRKFNPYLQITCMLNYGKLHGEEYKKFLDWVNTSYTNNFIPWEEIVSFEKYLKILKKSEIYICNNKTQSGLAVIYYSLLFGKKVYLTGYNLDWIRQLGFLVFDIDDISSISIEDFTAQLSTDNKRYNYNLFIESFDINILSGKWDSYYNTL